jgi:hypothetical protein
MKSFLINELTSKINVLVLFFWLGFLLLAGCKSRFVETTVENRSGAAVSVMEVSYPNASFGVDKLGDGADYHYHFKIQGSGRIGIEYDDATGKHHKAKGPELDEGQSGELRIRLLPNAEPEFQTSFKTDNNY